MIQLLIAVMVLCAREKDDMLVAWQRAKGQLKRKSESQAGIELRVNLITSNNVVVRRDIVCFKLTVIMQHMMNRTHSRALV